MSEDITRDGYPFPLPTTQILVDKFKTSRMDLVEKIMDPDGPRDITNLLAVIDRIQAEQIAACIGAVGALEAQLVALRDKLGIEDLEVPEFHVSIEAPKND